MARSDVNLAEVNNTYVCRVDFEKLKIRLDIGGDSSYLRRNQDLLDGTSHVI